MSARTLAAGIVLAACTGGGQPGPTQPSTPAPPTPHRGGEAIFGSEYWPECLNPVTACAAASWTHSTVLQHVLPRAMQLDPRGNFVASPLLVEAPALDNGGLTQRPFTVRFRISPAAVWDDGLRITSADFRFTWLANLNTVGSYRRAAYAHVVSVDATDLRTAVVEFDDVYIQWPDLFGGEFDYVLKAAAFAGKSSEKPNLSQEMQSDIAFSGGPFRLVSWTQDRAELVRNERYFGTRANLDRVTFVALGDQDPFEALLEGTISAASPDVWSKEPTDHVNRLPTMEVLGGDGIYFEALWFNHRVRPLDDPMVREALMSVIDRQALIDSLVMEWNPNARVLNCGLVALPNAGPWCRTHPFERFTYDPARARSLLVEAGYDCSVPGPCTKEGKPLELEYWVPEARVRRTLAQALLSGPAREGGFSLVLRMYGRGGAGIAPDPSNFALAQFARGGTVDPSVTEYLACQNIPNPPDFRGGNWNGWCDPKADLLMKASDRALDPDRRLALLEQVYELEARDFVSLPLYAIPAVSVWRTDQIAGPIGLYNSSPYGLFFNMNEWYLP